MNQSLRCSKNEPIFEMCWDCQKNTAFKCAKKVSLRWDKCLISYEIVEMSQSLKCVEIATNDPSTIMPKNEHLSEMCQKWGNLWNVFWMPKTIQVQLCQKANTSLRCAKNEPIFEMRCECQKDTTLNCAKESQSLRCAKDKTNA